jgi:hypothetical protein
MADEIFTGFVAKYCPSMGIQGQQGIRRERHYLPESGLGPHFSALISFAPSSCGFLNLKYPTSLGEFSTEVVNYLILIVHFSVIDFLALNLKYQLAARAVLNALGFQMYDNPEYVAVQLILNAYW